jgi:holo-[acyl-carrier protein] synthase
VAGLNGIPAAGVIGIGIDAVEVERMRATLHRTPSTRARLFTAGELADADRRPDPAERLAARFAAKEATMKALGVGLGAIDFHDVEVVRHESGRPELVVTGRAAELAAAQGVRRWLVSLTHTTTLAEAVVVAC